MPDVGEGLTEAEILKWYVRVGDTVTDGQVVCEVETAKAAVELPIPFDGTVHELRYTEGTTVDVGQTIISVDLGTASGAAVTERRPVLVGYGVLDSPTTRRRRRAAPVVNGNGKSGAVSRPLAKPPVRKLAKDLGVDLAGVVPTGPDGIITRDDVHHAARPPQAPDTTGDTTAAVPETAVTAVAGGVRETRIPVKGVRRATAQAMVASAFTAPHVTEFITVDVTRTMKLARALRDDPDLAGVRTGPLLLIARALLVALRRNPGANAAWDETAQEIVLKHYVNLGIAAATPRGLLVPNIKDAHTLPLPDLARALDTLVTTAREGRTAPADMRDGTVTITNVGVFGIDTGTPILNPGEAAILAVGAIRPRPWIHKGKIKPRHITTLALSFDHRLIDGELGSKLLADTATLLEHPKKLLTWI
ncbi:dihydrolipoamide acetyltransferase family protein [Streptomyces sp. NPDC000594]|uniref:dihydrolipoamide acetyltransferase family protein n=1 Tax=Streptomyces sp. NPDC000594 TaxID=3154261 RepID=UPI00332166A2